MRVLPERITVPTPALLALVELAERGVRSQAERLLVEGINQDLDSVSAAMAQKMIGVNDAANQQRSTGGAVGAQPAGAGGGDSGGAGDEPQRAGAELG